MTAKMPLPSSLLFKTDLDHDPMQATKQHQPTVARLLMILPLLLPLLPWLLLHPCEAVE
jgi:hypothetical protein